MGKLGKYNSVGMQQKKRNYKKIKETVGRPISGKILLPEDVIVKLRELRALRRTLTRPELEYILSIWNTYLAHDITRKTRWTSQNILGIKRRLFRATQSEDGYNSPMRFLKLDNTMDYFMELNKRRGFIRPTPMRWLIERLDYIAYKYNCFQESELCNVRVACSVAPRSSKSELLYAFIFRMLLEQPHLRIIYVSNNQSNIKRASSTVRNYLRDCGVIFSSDINNTTSFVIDKIPGHLISDIVCGGGLSTYTSASLPQGVTAQILIVDDLLANIDEANSEIRRSKINEAFLTNMIPRLTPDGAVIVVSTRYHTNDLISIITHPEFPDRYDYINIPAIQYDKNGEEFSYWPSYWPLEKLQKTRNTIGERAFQALYMGNPLSVEEALFGKCQRYEGQVSSGCSYIWGVDLAYSVKTKADYTSLSKMYYNPITKLYYVDKIYRWRKPIDATLIKIKEIVGDNRVVFAYGGTENAIVTLSKNYKLNIDGQRVTCDKYTRALPMSAQFNNILFHSSINEEYLKEVETFDGDPSRHDDTVDCLVSCFNELNAGRAKRSYEDIKNDMSALFSSHEDDDED